MVRNNELKETDTKNRTHNFNDTVNVNDLDLDNILLHKTHMKIFQFIMLHIKVNSIKSLFVLLLIK